MYFFYGTTLYFDKDLIRLGGKTLPYSPFRLLYDDAVLAKVIQSLPLKGPVHCVLSPYFSTLVRGSFWPAVSGLFSASNRPIRSVYIKLNQWVCCPVFWRPFVSRIFILLLVYEFTLIIFLSLHFMAFTSTQTMLGPLSLPSYVSHTQNDSEYWTQKVFAWADSLPGLLISFQTKNNQLLLSYRVSAQTWSRFISKLNRTPAHILLQRDLSKIVEQPSGEISCHLVFSKHD